MPYIAGGASPAPPALAEAGSSQVPWRPSHRLRMLLRVVLRGLRPGQRSPALPGGHGLEALPPAEHPPELPLGLPTGRNRGLELVFCTQRPNQLNEALTNEATEVVCFCLQGENAIKEVASLADRAMASPELALGSF